MTKKDLSREKNKMETPLLVENVVGNMQVGEGAHKPIDETKSKFEKWKEVAVYGMGYRIVCRLFCWNWMVVVGFNSDDEPPSKRFYSKELQSFGS